MYIRKGSPYPCFPWMVVMGHLLLGSLAHIVERGDVRSRKEAAVAVVRQQRCHYTHYQWLCLACNSNYAFDLSFNQSLSMWRSSIIYRD